MPELPEVERARKLIQDSCKGYKIQKIETMEDKIVYTGGTDHVQFGRELEGRTITGCERKGKMFWMTLSGEGRLPIMHFGMTGMVQLKGQEPTWYRRRPRENPKTWPPRFCKFIMQLEPQEGSVSDEPRELAFLDGRRLAKLRLLPTPVLDHPPLSLLGFDPVLSHPTFEEFQVLLKRKKGTIKGVIMDQAFSAGVGNWVADEILYQSRIHPACPVPLLTTEDLERLHYQIRNVPLTAVEVNADSRQFPEDWLFRWRWGKGKKHERGAGKNGTPKKGKGAKIEDGEGDGEGEEDVEEEDIKPNGKDCMRLADGTPATISFIEVGGRTTAFVEEVQKMPEGVEIKPKISKGGKGSQSRKRKGGDESDGSSPLSDPGKSENASSESEVEVKEPVKPTTPRQKGAVSVKIKEEVDTPTPTKKIKQNSDSIGVIKMARKSKYFDSDKSSLKRSSVGNARKSGGKRAVSGGGRRRESLGSDSSDLSDAPELAA